jgi:hypothetical protein
VTAVETQGIARLWRGGAPWTRSAVTATPRAWLILYLHTETEPMRPTTVQHLRFLDHSLTPHDVLRWNAAHGVPRWVRDYPFDVVLLHYSVLCMRWEAGFERWRSTLDWIRDSEAVRLAMPQDEFVCAHTLDEWLDSLDLDCVFSVLDERHWPTLYPRTSARTRMERSYTGFVDDRAAGSTQTLPRPHAQRPLDIVYRARNVPFHIGHHGQLKHRIAEIVDPAARACGLRTDISTRGGDTKYGDAWFEFLASGRSVIGAESGSSALDPYGDLRRFEPAWRAERPDATFEEFSALQPPGWDDYGFTAISPRLFEAAQMKTAQMLVEGEYDGILEADRHYVPLRGDLSNLDEALERIADPAETEAFAERTWEDLILSGRYSYGAFAAHVETVVEEVAGDRPRRASRGDFAWRAANAASDAYSAVVIRTPRLAHRFAARRAPWVADGMMRTRGWLREQPWYRGP